MCSSDLMRSLLLGATAAAIFVTTTYGQSILGPPSEANHFIETPRGWVHPKTPWGEPDIQANLNMMQAAGIPLERCASSVGRGGPCDMNKAWRTPEEYKKALDDAAGRGDRGRQLLSEGNFGAALLHVVFLLGPPQRHTPLIVDPPRGPLPALTPGGHRRAPHLPTGRARPRGTRPHGRGAAMTPGAPPRGGGEGRRAGGRHPVSKWGVLSKGGNTRHPRKASQRLIVRGRRRGPQVGR